MIFAPHVFHSIFNGDWVASNLLYESSVVLIGEPSLSCMWTPTPIDAHFSSQPEIEIDSVRLNV